MARPQVVSSPIIIPAPSLARFGHRGYASQSEEHDLVIIGGGVAGYVAAIKAGQEGLKVIRRRHPVELIRAMLLIITVIQ